uniref:Uncharacterized protein n=1 Tax=Anguilla anguilla TaxID=7936 RepID=A0A0E9QZY6_ANGAN
MYRVPKRSIPSGHLQNSHHITWCFSFSFS